MILPFGKAAEFLGMERKSLWARFSSAGTWYHLRSTALRQEGNKVWCDLDVIFAYLRTLPAKTDFRGVRRRGEVEIL